MARLAPAPIPAATPAATSGSTPDLTRKHLSRLQEHQSERDCERLSRKLRKRPLVLFFGRTTFSDNSKYLYLRALASARGYDVLWCTTSPALAADLTARGLPCLAIDASCDVTIDTFLHAAVAVFTINPFESVGLSLSLLGCLAGAQQVQLWHGVSVKRLNLQLLPYLGARGADIRQYWMANCAADHVLSTSSRLDGYWREVFGCRSLLRAGMPRNEVIMRAAADNEWLGAELPARSIQALQGQAPAVLIVPTWQRGKSTPLTETEFLAHALQFARRNGAEVFFKAHPAYFDGWSQGEGEIEGLHLIDPGVDIYPWLHRFDALVTDYSSIMFDYLLTGRPVLTLELHEGGHQRYEPDFSLVPPGEFRVPFQVEDFSQTLIDVLSSDRARDARLGYASQLFETDPSRASDTLLQVVDRLVEQSQAADFVVWNAAA